MLRRLLAAAAVTQDPSHRQAGKSRQKQQASLQPNQDQNHQILRSAHQSPSIATGQREAHAAQAPDQQNLMILHPTSHHQSQSQSNQNQALKPLLQAMGHRRATAGFAAQYDHPYQDQNPNQYQQQVQLVALSASQHQSLQLHRAN